jgi:hypothetical protein
MTTNKCQKVIDEIAQLLRIEQATQDHCTQMSHTARYSSNNTIGSFINQYNIIVSTSQHQYLFTADQMMNIRHRLYTHIVHWEKPNHRSIIDAITLALCREPWRMAKMNTSFEFCAVSVCYFANFGEIPIGKTIIYHLLNNCVRVQNYYDSVGNSLLNFNAATAS